MSIPLGAKNEELGVSYQMAGQVRQLLAERANLVAYGNVDRVKAIDKDLKMMGFDKDPAAFAPGAQRADVPAGRTAPRSATAPQVTTAPSATASTTSATAPASAASAPASAPAKAETAPAKAETADSNSADTTPAK